MRKTRATLSVRSISPLALAGLLSMGLAPSAGASEVTVARRLACTADAFRFCLGAIPNIEAVKACMIVNKAKLSPGCQAMFGKRK